VPDEASAAASVVDDEGEAALGCCVACWPEPLPFVGGLLLGCLGRWPPAVDFWELLPDAEAPGLRCAEVPDGGRLRAPVPDPPLEPLDGRGLPEGFFAPEAPALAAVGLAPCLLPLVAFLAG
jgi:hypothetical protein